MTYGRRRDDFPRHRWWLATLFYYIALSLLIAAFAIALYWQLEPDRSEFGLTEFHHTSTPENRAFFVPIRFCAGGPGQQFTLIRYYHDLDNNIFYAVPDGKYKTSYRGCFDTRVQAHTGRLDPGRYEYHISVEYQVNPLRTVRSHVAVVHLTIE